MSCPRRTLVAAKAPQLVENARDDPRLEVLQVRANKALREAIHASIIAVLGLVRVSRWANASNRKNARGSSGLAVAARDNRGENQELVKVKVQYEPKTCIS